MSGPKYPDVKVQLVGEDGNSYAIMGRVIAAMKAAGIDKEERDKFREEATSGDYSHLLNTCMEWVNCDPDEEEEDLEDIDDWDGLPEDEEEDEEDWDDDEEDDPDVDPEEVYGPED